MSLLHSVERMGEGLYIPRVEPEKLREEPFFNGMGALVGPGKTPYTLSVVLTGQRWTSTHLLDFDYQPITPGLKDIHLEGDQLSAIDPLKIHDNNDGRDFVFKWPLDVAYELPSHQAQLPSGLGLTQFTFDCLKPFFDADHKRYQSSEYLKINGFLAFAYNALFQHQMPNRQTDRYAQYHDGAVLLSVAPAGQLAIAPIGIVGAGKYLLNQDGSMMSRKSYAFEVKRGKIYGKNRDRRTRLAFARLGSRQFVKVPLGSES